MKVKLKGTFAMIAAFLIYYEFWLVLVCWHVGPDVLACWSWNRGNANSGKFVLLSCLVLFEVAEGKVQRYFCNASCLSDL